MGSYADCTVGAVVDSAGVRRFVSASHCTTNIFSVNNDSIATTGGTYVGHETAEPAGTYVCGGILCWYHRSSDAALFSFSGGYQTKKGVIGRTSSRDSIGLGGTVNTTLNSSHPWLFVTDTESASSMAVGTKLDHMGWRSGWQHGTMTRTCEDVVIGGDGFFYTMYKSYCEGEFHSYANGGDSGGPTFIYDGYDGAVFAGLENAIDGTHDSCGSGNEGLGVLFSYWTSIVLDLGSLDPLNNTTVDSPTISGSVNGSSQGVINWSAPGTTNTSATTSYQIWRSAWNASTGTWTQTNQFIGTITSTSYTDAGAPFSVTSSTGGSPPNACQYSFTSLLIRAYNQGAYAYSNTVYFQGPSNGPGGVC